jgi:hypothetical protein
MTPYAATPFENQKLNLPKNNGVNARFEKSRILVLD